MTDTDNDTKVQEDPQVSPKDQTSQFQQMLDGGDFVKIPKIGEIVKGTIIDVSRSEIRLDVDGLTTGIVRGREFYDESSEYSDLKVDDEVEATVIELENENGEMELSLRFAGHQKAWDNLSSLEIEGSIVQAHIVDANRGGLMIKVGKISGFLPVSQLMPEHYPRVPGGDKTRILERLKSYVGSDFEVKVISVDESEDKLIVSEKAAWEEKQKDVIASYKVSDVVEGKVTAVTDFGVFVEFGKDNLEGLIHISELAWQRIDNPSDLVKVGDKIKAEIINVEGSKIFLSIKKLQADPWSKIGDKYKIGQIVKCKVLKVNPFGLFVELDPDIHGLAHVSELSDKPVTDTRDIAKPGDELDFKILSIEPSSHRLGLSIKALKGQDKQDKQDKPASAEASAGKQDKVEEQKPEVAEESVKEKEVDNKQDEPVDVAEKEDKPEPEEKKEKKEEKPAETESEKVEKVEEEKTDN